MRVLVIPDVHGTDIWKTLIKQFPEHDKIVFLGDYVDNWNNEHPQQENNLREIFDYKRSNPNKVELCIGNHDLSYFSESREGSNCSGHQWEYAELYYKMFTENIDILNACVLINGVLFSHAGISQFWYNKVVGYYNDKHKFDKIPKELMKEYEHWVDVEKNINDYYFDGRHFSLVGADDTPKEDVDAYYKYKFEAQDKINELYYKMLNEYKWDKIPSYKFYSNRLNRLFKEKYSTLDHCGWESSGNSSGESCVWIRPEALLKDNWPEGIKGQVVGHTEIGIQYLKWRTHKLIVCDNRYHNCGLIIDTEKFNEYPFTRYEYKKYLSKGNELLLELFKKWEM